MCGDSKYSKLIATVLLTKKELGGLELESWIGNSEWPEWKWSRVLFKKPSMPGTVAHACNPSYLGG
jgi:hypothetical protein